MKKKRWYGLLGLLSLLGFIGVFTQERAFLGFFAFGSGSSGYISLTISHSFPLSSKIVQGSSAAGVSAHTSSRQSGINRLDAAVSFTANPSP